MGKNATFRQRPCQALPLCKQLIDKLWYILGNFSIKLVFSFVFCGIFQLLACTPHQLSSYFVVV